MAMRSNLVVSHLTNIEVIYDVHQNKEYITIKFGPITIARFCVNKDDLEIIANAYTTALRPTSPFWQDIEEQILVAANARLAQIRLEQK